MKMKPTMQTTLKTNSQMMNDRKPRGRRTAGKGKHMPYVEIFSDERLKEILPIVGLGTSGRFLAYKMEIFSPCAITQIAKTDDEIARHLIKTPAKDHEIWLELHRDDLTRWQQGVTSMKRWWKTGRRKVKHGIRIYLPQDHVELRGKATLQRLDFVEGTIELRARKLVCVADVAE